MTNLALIGASITASGHPGACGSTVSGSVTGGSSVSVNGTPIAASSMASLDFGSHGHDVDDEGDCISFTSHSVQQVSLADSISINGNGVYLEVSGAATDPGSGGSIDYTNSGGNSTVKL